jgi:hypothetical protein
VGSSFEDGLIRQLDSLKDPSELIQGMQIEVTGKQKPSFDFYNYFQDRCFVDCDFFSFYTEIVIVIVCAILFLLYYNSP